MMRNNHFHFALFIVPENIEEQLKRHKIETALKDPATSLSKWQEFAKSDYGLVNGNCSCASYLFYH